MAFYEEEGPRPGLRCYVNVGGGVASLGSSNNRPALPSGLIYDLGPHNWSRKGNLVLFAERGVPVLHLLRVQTLARENGLPISPDYLALPGEGEIFVKTMYRFPVALIMLLVYCGLCVLILAPEVSRGLFDKIPRRSPPAPVIGRKSS